MKIIKQGKLPGEKTHRTTCSRCKSVMEETGDKLHWEHYPRDESLARAECPICGNQVHFYPGKD